MDEDTVLAAIQKHPKGISVTALEEELEIDVSVLMGILNELSKKVMVLMRVEC